MKYQITAMLSLGTCRATDLETRLEVGPGHQKEMELLLLIGHSWHLDRMFIYFLMFLHPRLTGGYEQLSQAGLQKNKMTIGSILMHGGLSQQHSQAAWPSFGVG